MKILILTAGCLLAVPLYPQSLIGRARYVPAEPGPFNVILAPQPYIRSLPPLPAYQPLPQQLPPDLSISYDDWQQTRNLREANRLMHSGAPEQAVELFRAFLETNPDEVQIRVSLADALFAMEEFTAAEAEYRNVLAQAPFHFQALNNLAWMYCTSPLPEQQKPAEALIMARRAQTLMPNSHHVWSTLSQALYHLGQYREALEAANQSINLAGRTGAGLRTQITYLIQVDRCRLALEATSILEE
jgi:tetratricopeptide (TPR) repeat protein